MDVPDYVSTEARRGLEWHGEGKSGDGVTDQTIAEARDMAAGTATEDKVRRMGPWFQRHRPDMDAPKNDPASKDFPGAGAVAWALWGGPTSGDIMQTADWAESKVASLDREKEESKAKATQPELTANKYMTIEERAKAAEAAVSALTAERDDLRKTVEDSVVSVSSDLDSLKVELASKESALAELNAKLEQATAKVASLEASAQSASMEAATILASSGVEPIKAQAVSENAAMSLAEQYASMPAGPERRAFLKKHKIVLFSK